MSSCDDKDAVYDELYARIEEAKQLIAKCETLENVQGKGKLCKKIKAELNFLEKLKDARNLAEEHVRSSNIYQLSALVRKCTESQGVIKVLHGFHFYYPCQQRRLFFDVDIVADYGATWIKVVSRNPRHLCEVAEGQGKYGRKSIVQQVEDMQQCAIQNPHMFNSPKTVLYLAAGVTLKLKKKLEKHNIEVQGEIVGDDVPEYPVTELFDEPEKYVNMQYNLNDIHMDYEPYYDHSLCQISPAYDSSPQNTQVKPQQVPDDAVLNLDVSTLLAYVSNMTNGHCDAIYKEKILMELAEMERACPVKPILDNLFEGKSLVCCQTAKTDFSEILKTVGGENERRRAEEFFKRVNVVPDCPSLKAMLLQKTCRIKERAKIVFGTGAFLKYVTVSANLGFLRAAESQGYIFDAFIHESRALTEMKEIKRPVDTDCKMPKIKVENDGKQLKSETENVGAECEELNEIENLGAEFKILKIDAENDGKELRNGVENAGTECKEQTSEVEDVINLCNVLKSDIENICAESNATKVDQNVSTKELESKGVSSTSEKN